MRSELNSAKVDVDVALAQMCALFTRVSVQRDMFASDAMCKDMQRTPQRR